MSLPPDDNSPLDPALQQGTPGARASSRGDEPTRVSTGETGPIPPAGGDDIPLGPSIEGYMLKEEIHRGGQGIVYRALQLGTKRLVALKVLLEGPLAAETVRRRFEREIELAASLRHPNIVTILDSGLSRGRYYFAME
jgi:serine/threonine protein kinase